MCPTFLSGFKRICSIAIDLRKFLTKIRPGEVALRCADGQIIRKVTGAFHDLQNEHKTTDLNLKYSFLIL